MTKTLITAAVFGAGLALAGCAKAPLTRASIEAAPPQCADFQVSIYFERDEDRITREARQVLASAAAMAKGCAVAKARVVGLADAVGTSDVNLALSKRRALSVTEALGRVGFGKVEFDLDAAGDAGATTGSGVTAPLRRRADIFFELGGRP